jgi:hypothetical protein
MRSLTTVGVGTAFYQNAGYNLSAEANNMIVLYPQPSASPANPGGCRD